MKNSQYLNDYGEMAYSVMGDWSGEISAEPYVQLFVIADDGMDCRKMRRGIISSRRSARWCSGYGVGIVIERSRVRLSAGALPGSLGQLSLPSLRGM